MGAFAGTEVVGDVLRRFAGDDSIADIGASSYILCCGKGIECIGALIQMLDEFVREKVIVGEVC